MVVSPRKRLILPMAPLAAAGTAVLIVGLFFMLPTGLLESLVVDSGIAAVLSAAEPPLGLTARAVLALLCGGLLAAIAWFGVFLAVGTRSVIFQYGGGAGEDAPVLRRADAHPDAPPRRPVFANRDLGTPFLDVRAPVHASADVLPPPPPVLEEQPLPVDLDLPLAAFDPAAVLARPLPWSAAPRLQTFAPGERLDTFALVPPLRVVSDDDIGESEQVATAPAPRPDPSATIHALLDRLERSVARREPEPAPQPAPETLQDKLSALRQLAMRAS